MPSLMSSPGRHVRRWTLPAGLLMALGIVALSVAPATATDHRVTIQQYAYGPSSMSVSQGDTVTWTNLDTVEHDVVVTRGPASFRSPLLSKGQSWSHTFTSPGTYSYICSVHPEMRAAIVAAPAPPPTTAAPAPAPTTAAPVPTPTRPSATPKSSPKEAATPQPSAPSATPAAQPAPAAAQPEEASTTLDPLLLVAGVAIAVVVFCLLLMASRPVRPPDA
jgi:plastocyanin